ncbi:MAG TPA: low molecular weight protein-tyrosine-phosphatase [Solirubrobacteraceae bacterium]|nr:low molecular weight protein-tyrosine-phosphatase [Solirubrobacteraceae bacterium]
MVRLLFVCLGNICRSPTAEAVMRELVRARGLDSAVRVASAGTGDWHIGSGADPRAVSAAAGRGVVLDGVARQVVPADLDRFDLLLAADRANHRALLELAGDSPQRRARVRLLREFDPASVAAGELEVPDPYFGAGDGFEAVLDICEAACTGLLAELVTSGRVVEAGRVRSE